MNKPFQPSDNLDSLQFDNAYVRELPGDPLNDNSRRQVPDGCYSLVKPTPVINPQLIAHSPEMAATLGIGAESIHSARFAEVFGGNALLPGMEPFAMCYGGHQFGNWAGQLGDGRAINLGELLNRHGERWTLQLKGAGPTPYSRRGDGLAVLRSSIREFLCSEAMFHLGIPTTRALSLVLTGEGVIRDMFYDGHPAEEPGAVVCRVSPSFIRFGNFEIHAARGKKDILRQLIEYTIRTDFPEIDPHHPERHLIWFTEVCRRTATLMAHWLRVGFVHGVMNTDNMSILGLTIDYGPYGWIDNYNPNWTPNTTDAQGRRYAFSRQPSIGMWNLAQLANAIYPVTGEAERLQEILSNDYHHHFISEWRSMAAAKLGLAQHLGEQDEMLVAGLFDLLATVETDMTIFFRQLALLGHSDLQATDAVVPSVLLPAYYDHDQLDGNYLDRLNQWLKSYQARLILDGRPWEVRQRQMNMTNPKYILRNYLAQVAIEKAECGDYSRIDELLALVRHPYDEQAANEKLYYRLRPDWARHKAGCSMLS